MNWYEQEVKHLENIPQEDRDGHPIIFYGSSSIRQWGSLQQDFPDYKVINLGFGGSTLAACVWFFDRIFLHYAPEAFIFYAGDNDLGDGRHPEELFIFFQQLVIKVDQRFGKIPCYFISLKPSISRWGLIDQFRYANQLIEQEIEQKHENWKFIDIFTSMLTASGNPNPIYYGPDGLHLSKEGYFLWKTIIQKSLK